MLDLTDCKRAAEGRQNDLWSLECMDRINRAMQGTNDLEQMMSDVLDAVLEIFACDRAWLVYPCDPQAPSWRAAMERTRPECPGAFALGTDLPVDTEVAAVFGSARASSSAVSFGPAYELPVPVQVAERFSIRTQIAIAVYPKVDKPYLFGLHQCSRARLWTVQEKRLFDEIARRLAEALTSLLIFRSLRESERKLEQAQRIAHVGYCEHDLETDRITWSDETYRIFGLPPREHSMDFAGVQALIHPEDREITVRAAVEGRASAARYDVEYRVVRPDGELRIVHGRGDVMRDRPGRPQRMFGTIQDITELRRAQQEARESERRYREVQQELAHANRIATLGQLTASIAHEVNQPLAAMSSNAEAALRWLGRRPPDLGEVRQALACIVRDGHRAAGVIGRIRDLVKKAPPRKDLLEINGAIREVIEFTLGEALKNGICVQTELADGLPLIQGDRVQLQQVLLNLIVNAIDAMSGVSSGSRELLIGTGKTSGGVLVAVRDSGPGLAPATLERVFESFYTTKPSGLGLGLSICRSIIEAHGGRLWASANAPRGTVFQFTVPDSWVIGNGHDQ